MSEPRRDWRGLATLRREVAGERGRALEEKILALARRALEARGIAADAARDRLDDLIQTRRSRLLDAAWAEYEHEDEMSEAEEQAAWDALPWYLAPDANADRVIGRLAKMLRNVIRSGKKKEALR